MLDKELFFSLCEKYNVELSKTAKTPIIRLRNCMLGEKIWKSDLNMKVLLF